MKNFTLLFIFFLVTLFAVAQPPRGTGGKRSMVVGTIIGKVIDAETNEPLEYTNVALYKLRDSSIVTGAITAKNGEFHLEKVKGGRYYLIVNFVGYTNYISDTIKINAEHKFVDLGKIKLQVKSEVLEAFEVEAEKEAIEFKMDKKVVNVDKLYTAASGTTVDILENVPSIAVDAERNVTLRGSSGFTVLVDGRPTVLPAADVLEQYPASAVESIEIITNPSAKYDPEGTAGIINIITKKQKQLGVSGIANVNLGMYDNYGGDVLVQVKKQKVSWFIGADLNNRGRVGKTETYNATENSDTINVVGGDGDFSSKRLSGTFRAGTDIKINNKNYWLIEGSVQGSDRKRRGDLDYTESTNGIVYDNYNSLNESSRESYNWSLNTDYTHKFRGDDKKLTIQGSYSQIQGDEYTLNELFDLDDRELNYGQRATEVGPNENGQVRVNFENRIHDSLKYEIGYQGTYDASADEFGTQVYDPVTKEYLSIDSLHRNSTYNRFIHAPYAIFNASEGKFGYQVGLRAEFTNRDVSVVGDPTDYAINRVDLFPTVHVSYELPKKHQLMASYSRRIERPRSWNLEPYVTARDQWNYRGGNPNLAPEYIDAAEIGYQKRFDKTFVSAEVYYRYTSDKVERIRQAYPEQGPGVTIQIPENVGISQAFGMEAMVKSPLKEWWDVSLMLNLYDYRVQGSYTDYVNDITQNFDNSSTNYTIRLNQTFKAFTHTKIQFNGRYNSPTVSAQGTQTGFVDFSAAIRSEIIKKKLSMNLQARNLFATALHESTSSGPGFESRSKFVMAGPVLILTATYKLNNYKPNRRKPTSGGGEE